MLPSQSQSALSNEVRVDRSESEAKERILQF